MKDKPITAEQKRLNDTYTHGKPWLKWGPYLSERQWGTVREDYSDHGNAWEYFLHDHARSRVYRWGEDGLAGISDDKQRICFGLALWNGKDPILKERLYGLTGPEGNHGEDVKELYYYLDNVPSHAYMKHLYKYPQESFPYQDLSNTNKARSKQEPEYELLDTPAFDNYRYFDIYTEYAKASEEDILIHITVCNRGDQEAPIWVLPTLWFRNLWSFGLMEEKPIIQKENKSQFGGSVHVTHPEIGDYHFYFQPPVRTLFTENETNELVISGKANKDPFVKDAFHAAIINEEWEPFSSEKHGTKFAPVYQFNLGPGQHKVIKLRFSKQSQSIKNALGEDFYPLMDQRKVETNEFYQPFEGNNPYQLKNIQRQAFAGMLWTKQYYNIDIPRWLNGDPDHPEPPSSRKFGRNSDWPTLNNEDIISMPDKWEYPWYAAWDLAFHCLPLAMIDPEFAKEQLILFLREWYMNPKGQIPAYEWAFSDVNPPVHAWACLEVFKIDKAKNGQGDLAFLERVFQKLLINFTWWVNQKDRNGNNVFEGGFLGLDNIGVFDRSKAIPGNGYLEQADGTAWMGMYCLNMLEIALILGENNEAYEDIATKFFEHFIYISTSLNTISLEYAGIWDEHEGFFYDILVLPGNEFIPIKVRSLVGLTSLFAVLNIKKEQLKKLPAFYERVKWFIKYQKENNEYLVVEDVDDMDDIFLSMVPKPRLERLLHALFDEEEFLSKGGIRSLSKIHQSAYQITIKDQPFSLQYEPGESTTRMFGGNSNWRGPIWFPMNYLLISSFRAFHQHYGNQLKVEFPTGAENALNLGEIANEVANRLISIFLPDEQGNRPVNGKYSPVYQHEHFRDLILFFEYFHGDDGHGLGASHQTGWTGLIAMLIQSIGENAED